MKVLYVLQATDMFKLSDGTGLIPHELYALQISQDDIYFQAISGEELPIN